MTLAWSPPQPLRPPRPTLPRPRGAGPPRAAAAGRARGAAPAPGIVAGGVALAATELLAGLLPGAPSVVLEIGAFLIWLQPPGAKQIVVDLFGTADKLALNIAIVLGALVLAAGLGTPARPH